MSIALGAVFYFFNSPEYSIVDFIFRVMQGLFFGFGLYFATSVSPRRQYDYKLEIHEDKISITNDLMTLGKTFYWEEVKLIKFSISKELTIEVQTSNFIQIRKIMACYEKAIDDVVTMAFAQNPKIKIDAKSRRRLEKFINKKL